VLKIEFFSDCFSRAPWSKSQREACCSAGQHRSRITLHHHIKNPVL